MTRSPNSPKTRTKARTMVKKKTMTTRQTRTRIRTRAKEKTRTVMAAVGNRQSFLSSVRRSH